MRFGLTWNSRADADRRTGAKFQSGFTCCSAFSRRIRVSYIVPMTKLRIRDAAVFLGVSDDTVRRWVDAGALAHEVDESRRKVIDGRVLAEFAQSMANPMPDPSEVGRSARNRFVGLVTRIDSDKVMSQVEMQCGPFRVVSLMSTEGVRELGLEPGSIAVAVVKATTVIVEVPHSLP
jgi:molybdopterin-binding protein